MQLENKIWGTEFLWFKLIICIKRIRKMFEKLLHFTHIKKEAHSNRKTSADLYYEKIPNTAPVEPESRTEVLIFTYNEHL